MGNNIFYFNGADYRDSAVDQIVSRLGADGAAVHYEDFDSERYSVNSVWELSVQIESRIRELFSTEKVVFIGENLGGWIGLLLELSAPGRFVSLILSSPWGTRLATEPTIRDFRDMYVENHDDIHRALYGISYSDFVAQIIESGDAAREQYAKRRELIAKLAWKPYLYTPNIQNFFAKIESPLTLISSSRDTFVREGYYTILGEALADRLKSQAVLTDSPHVLRYGELEAYTGLLLEGMK